MKTHTASIPMFSRPLILFLILLLFMAFLPVATPVQAATVIEVTSTEDPLTPSSTDGCTLREAIIAANERRAVNDCPPGGAETRIVLPPYAEILELNACLPKIAANVSLIGERARPFTISASRYNSQTEDTSLSLQDPQSIPCRVFFVDNGQVRFENLIIAGGWTRGGRGGDGLNGGGGGGGGAGMGGGIFINDGIVTLDNIWLRDNKAEGGDGGSGSPMDPPPAKNGGGGGGGGARFDGQPGETIRGGNGGGGGALYDVDSIDLGWGSGSGSDTAGAPGSDGSGGGGGGPCQNDEAGGGGFPGYGAGGGASGGCNSGGAAFAASGNFGGGGGGSGARTTISGGGNGSVAFGGFSGNGNAEHGGGGGGGAGLGGGIFVRSGTLIINESSFTNNQVEAGKGGASGGSSGGSGETRGSAIFADNAARVSFSSGNVPSDLETNNSLTFIRNDFATSDVPVVNVGAELRDVDATDDIIGFFTLNFSTKPKSPISINYALEGTASAEHYTSDPRLQPEGGVLRVDPAQLGDDNVLTVTVTRRPGDLSSRGRTLDFQLLPSESYVIGENASDSLTITQDIPPWLVLLYIAGDDQVPTGDVVNPNLVRSLSEPMNQLVNRLTATLPQSDTYRLVVLTDGNQPGDSRLYVSDPTPLGGSPLEQAPGLQELPRSLLPSWFPSDAELDMGKASTLQSFVRWSKEQYAGYRYSMISIVGHGGGWAQDIESVSQPSRSNAFLAGGWRGLSVDMGSAMGQAEIGVSSLSTLDTGQVFAGLGDFGSFDVMFFDACLMGMAESLYEVRDYTQYIIAGENILWGELPYEDYLAGIELTTEPKALATHIIDEYNKDAPDNEPFVIAAVNANKLVNLRALVDELAAKLLADLEDPAQRATTLALLKQVYADVQKLDYNADLEIDADTDGYVDLAHFAQLINAQSTDPAVKESARKLSELFTGEDSIVIALNRRLFTGNVAQLDTIWELTDTYGISIYFPLGEEDCRPTTTTTDPNVETWKCDSMRPEWAEQTDELPRLVYERQLEEYLQTRNLSFVRHAPAWKDLLKKLDDSDAIPAIVSRSYTPFQVTERTRTFLPIVASTELAELTGSISFDPTGSTFTADQRVRITATITNSGSGDARPFWVELYIDPANPPTGPNQRWEERCRNPVEGCFGISWELAEGLKSGETRTVDSLVDYDVLHTVWPGCFAAGTQMLYLSVDSWDPGISYGRVRERNEDNNIFSQAIEVLPAPAGSVCPGVSR